MKCRFTNRMVLTVRVAPITVNTKLCPRSRRLTMVGWTALRFRICWDQHVVSVSAAAAGHSVYAVPQGSAAVTRLFCAGRLAADRLRHPEDRPRRERRVSDRRHGRVSSPADLSRRRRSASGPHLRGQQPKARVRVLGRVRWSVPVLFARATHSARELGSRCRDRLSPSTYNYPVCHKAVRIRHSGVVDILLAIASDLQCPVPEEVACSQIVQFLVVNGRRGAVNSTSAR